LPALDRDAADVITGSEHILKAYADKHSLTATAIVDLIKNVLKNPEFNADDVDTDMPLQSRCQHVSVILARSTSRTHTVHHTRSCGGPVAAYKVG
jgi:hypothetical protein